MNGRQGIGERNVRVRKGGDLQGVETVNRGRERQTAAIEDSELRTREGGR